MGAGSSSQNETFLKKGNQPQIIYQGYAVQNPVIVQAPQGQYQTYQIVPLSRTQPISTSQMNQINQAINLNKTRIPQPQSIISPPPQNPNPNNLQPNVDSNLKKEYPTDSYACPYCNNIPEILGLNPNMGIIKINCPYHSEISLNVYEYYKRQQEFTYYSKKCEECLIEIQKNHSNKFIYCYYCQKVICPLCFQYHTELHKTQCIYIGKIPERCLKHFHEEKFAIFCKDCVEHICLEDIEKHTNCKNKINFELDFFPLVQKKVKVIENKYKELKTICRIYETIVDSYRHCPNNYYHCINIIKLADEIEKNRKGDLEEIKQLEKIFESINNKFEEQKNVLDNLKNEFKIEINGIEKNLDLRNRGLNDKAISLMSKINFSNLEELNVSNNNITSLKNFENFNSPNIKNLIIKANLIKDISSLEKMSNNFKNLEILNLSKNKINDISVLNKAVFPKLNKLSLQNNDINQDLQEVKDILEKNKGKISVENNTFEDFCDQFDVDDSVIYSNNYIVLKNKKIGNEGLKLLFSSLSTNDGNINTNNSNSLVSNLISNNRMIDFSNIKKINLEENEISDISYFKNHSFDNLVELYLGLNQIEDISIFGEVEFPKLKCLNIMGNKIQDIQVFKPLKLPSLKILYINSNPIEYQNDSNQEIIKYLKRKNVDVSYRGINLAEGSLNLC